MLVALEAADEEQPQGAARLEDVVQLQGEVPAAELRVAVEGVVPRVGHAVAVAQAVAVLPVYYAVAAGSCVVVRQVSAAQHCCAAVPAAPGVRCC